MENTCVVVMYTSYFEGMRGLSGVFKVYVGPKAMLAASSFVKEHENDPCTEYEILEDVPMEG